MIEQDIAIAMPLEEKLLSPLYHWGQRFDWGHVKRIHLVHVVKKNVTPFEFGLVELPDEATYESMRPTLETFLRTEAQKILPDTFRGEISLHLSRHAYPEEEMVEILQHLNATMVVVATQGKHGLEGFFHNSFTDHLVRFAPCDVYVVRPEK